MADDPITVDVAGLGQVSFPAGTSEADMKRAIDTQLAQAHVSHGEAVPHPIAKRLLEWLPTVGGMAGGIIGGIGGTVGGAVIGGAPGAIGGAAVGGATGEALKQVGNYALGNPSPTTHASAATDIAGQAALQGGAEAAGVGLVAAGKAVAPRLMQSAVKPSLAAVKDVLKTAEVPKVIQTLLDEGINVSKGGVEKLNRLISATNDEIKTAIASAKGWVYPEAVAARTEPVAAKFANQVNPMSDVGAVKAAGDEFLQARSHGQFPAKPLSLPEAQALKIGTYQSLGQKAYGELKGATIEAQKAMARGLKEDIASEAAKAGVSNINALNAREGAAMQARDAIARRVTQANNRDPAGLAWLSQNPATFLAFLMDRNPAVKSMIARSLYNSAGVATRVDPQIIRFGVQALASSQDDQ